jgi:hypothetical protein
MAFCVFEFDSHRVRGGQTHIRDDSRSAQGLPFGSASVNEDLDHGNAGGLVAFPRITGDELSLPREAIARRGRKATNPRSK